MTEAWMLVWVYQRADPGSGSVTLELIPVCLVATEALANAAITAAETRGATLRKVRLQVRTTLGQIAGDLDSAAVQMGRGLGLPLQP